MRINNGEDIRFALITGDVTESAQYNEFVKAEKILSELKVPWLPLLGNHDVWTYTKQSEEPYPTGGLPSARTCGMRMASQLPLETPSSPRYSPHTSPLRHRRPARTRSADTRASPSTTLNTTSRATFPTSAHPFPLLVGVERFTKPTSWITVVTHVLVEHVWPIAPCLALPVPSRSLRILCT